MPEHFVARSGEIREGERRIVTAGRHVVGVLRAKGRLHAFRNQCPHQGGPVCQGLMIHKVEAIIGPDKTYRGSRFNENELHLVCPWHGWEFNIETGRCAGDGRVGLRRYEVVERNDEIYVLI